MQFLRRIEDEASFLSHKKRGRIKREQRGSWASLPLLLPGGREFFLSSLFSLSLFCPSPPLPLCLAPSPPLFRPLRTSFSPPMPFSNSSQSGPVANGGDKVRIDRARGARGCSSLVVVDRRIEFVLLRSISPTPSWSLSTLFSSSAPRNWRLSGK